ncbi:MAG TPA: ABC transporter substrate-binding protein [Burkholderiales bacterium]|jgi:phospholipid transport system substrate-binding protein|nr:ABC transporter substrate-binding protein [Burkholderiales bacterium]
MSETLSLAFAFAWLFAVPAAQSQEVPPDVLMKNLSGEIIAEIRRDKALQAGDAAKIAALVEAKIVPHFDLRRITQLAVGPGWRRATPEQQDRLTQEFKTLLVRTYSGALASYRDQAIEFRPLRAAAGDTEVTVKSLIRQSGAESIAVEYDLARVGAQWKVFDVRIGGISLVATYRSSFAEEVRNNGVDGLIAQLSRKNRQS